MAERQSSTFSPTVNNCCHLHSGTASQFISIWNRNIIWHEPALHEHPRLMTYNMKNTDEGFFRSLDNFYNLSFTTLICLFPCHSYADNITMQRTSCLACFHKHVVFVTIGNHKDITFTSHLHLTRHLWKHLLFPPATPSCVGILLSSHPLYHKFRQN